MSTVYNNTSPDGGSDKNSSCDGAVSAVRQRLFAMQDEGYRDFVCRLIPTTSPDTVIGIRTPQLRLYARELAGTPDAAEFMGRLPHGFYEENNLHGLLIERIRDCEECFGALDAFLPYVDNWATCDIIRPRVFGKNVAALVGKCDEWIASRHTYTVRFGIEMLMSFCLDDCFDTRHLNTVAAVRSEEYYVRMMVAWYFATALAKQYDAALPYIEQRRLDSWTHNKTIRKAIESYRIDDGRKAYLRSLADRSVR